MTIGHLLNRSVEVWREATVPDGAGGQQTTRVQVATLPVRISQPTAGERVLADAAGADLTHQVYLDPGADVARGDELRDPDGRVLEVLAVIGPSATKYMRADCQQRQTQGGP